MGLTWGRYPACRDHRDRPGRYGRACSNGVWRSLVSVPVWGTGGRGFESHYPDPWRRDRPRTTVPPWGLLPRQRSPHHVGQVLGGGRVEIDLGDVLLLVAHQGGDDLGGHSLLRQPGPVGVS
jgi:hypothetical protein